MNFSAAQIIEEIDSIAATLEDSPLYFQSQQTAEGITAMRQAAEKFATATTNAGRINAARWVREAYLLFSSSLPDAGETESETCWATAGQIAKLFAGPTPWEARICEEFGGGAVTPAELRTLREACGLSLSQLSAAAGVQERTARYWESGSREVPEDVAGMVQQLDAQLTQAAHQGVHVIAETARAHPEHPLEIVLIRYRTDADLHRYRPDMAGLPATTHAAILYRTRATLDGEGIPSRIVYLDPEAYDAWRGNRKDTESLRAEWAAMQIK